jgi:hypothetical protein
MKRLLKVDGFLGLGCMLFALALLFVWIPADTESGILERVRGHQVIGDALAPTVVGWALLFSGLLVTVGALSRDFGAGLTLANLTYLIRLTIVLVVSLSLMRWTGPFVVDTVRFLGADLGAYRDLRDMAPWKYLGYLAGGSFLVTALIAMVEHRLRWRQILIGFAAALAFALIYDIPFQSLLLPPNGDV